MDKKLKVILICVILILTTIPTFSSTNNVALTDYNNETVFQTELFPDFPVMEDFQFNLDPIKESPEIIPLVDLPSEFSWTNYDGKDWTTLAKHQGNCGSCWAFGAIGVFESMIKIREESADLNPDLSEQYILSCLSSAGSCRGGSSYRAFQYIYETTSRGNYHNGVIPESCMEYQANDDISCSDKCDNWQEQLVPLLSYDYKDINGGASGRDLIKTQILQNGPVVTHMKVTESFKLWGVINHNPDAYYPRFKPTFGFNHVVMIAGWKDSLIIPSGGYWICKNSWGEGFGYNGFFNIAYGALNIDKTIIWADYNPDSFNWAPYADTGGPYGAYVEQEVSFNANKSIGYEGEIIDYSWEFGDGGTGSGLITSHIYNETGIYTLTLNITDIKNNKASATTKVWVQETNNGPDTPSIEGSSSGEVWKEHDYKIYSVDPDGNELLYYIDWGEGKIEEWIGPFASGEEIIVSHTWFSLGNYNVKVKVKDPFNYESDWGTLKVTMPRNRLLSFTFLHYIQDLFGNWFKS